MSKKLRKVSNKYRGMTIVNILMIKLYKKMY